MKSSPDMLAYPHVGKNEVLKRDNHMRRTKIVCTIGPATESEEQLEQLMRAGMNVARLNFSHGTQQEHKRVIERVRALSARLG
jgi:pyruvate kinase